MVVISGRWIMKMVFDLQGLVDKDESVEAMNIIHGD